MMCTHNVPNLVTKRQVLFRAGLNHPGCCGLHAERVGHVSSVNGPASARRL